jgi:hypothetical protein
MNKLKTKKEYFDQLKKLSAQIGKLEIQRGMYGNGEEGGKFVSVKEIDKVKREFKDLSNECKRKFYPLVL